MFFLSSKKLWFFLKYEIKIFFKKKTSEEKLLTLYVSIHFLKY